MTSLAITPPARGRVGALEGLCQALSRLLAGRHREDTLGTPRRGGFPKLESQSGKSRPRLPLELERPFRLTVSLCQSCIR